MSGVQVLWEDGPVAHTIFEDLAMVRRRPGMYTGSNRLSDLGSFVSGYRMAAHGQDWRLRTKNGLPLQYLHFHLARKYGQPAAMGWCRILLATAGGDEEAGLALFFRELDEFEALSIRRVEEFVRTPEREAYNRSEPTVPRIAYGVEPPDTPQYIPRFSDMGTLYKITLSDGVQMLAVEQKKDERVVVETDSLLVFWEKLGIDGVMERCFGSVAWAESGEDFRGERALWM